MKLKDVWATQEWKDFVKKHLKDKCEWCDNLKKLPLTLHHEENFFDNLKWNEEKITRKKFREKFDVKGNIKKSVLIVYKQDNFEEINKEAWEITLKEYISDDAPKITLCRACHFAIRKGMFICSYCKKNYHKMGFESCWDCKDKEEVKKAIEEAYIDDDDFD